MPATLLKRNSSDRSFPVIVAKFIKKASILKNICERLLLVYQIILPEVFILISRFDPNLGGCGGRGGDFGLLSRGLPYYIMTIL